MGYSGHCQLRPVHISGLLKRYCVLLGEQQYVEKNDRGNTDRTLTLTETIWALASAIKVCAPEIELSALRPKRYMPPEPLRCVARHLHAHCLPRCALPGTA
jgi:hypothetical protein